jgi:RNA polymerase sigma-70 factor (ECF subfamily)
MAGERTGHSLQATALVNEAYIRLLDVQHVSWQNRAHFLAMAARLMRRILVDVARAKRNQKRGGEAIRVTFDEEMALASEDGHDLVAINDGLDEYVVSSDGQRFLMNTLAEGDNPSPITVILNWRPKP